MRYAFFYFIIAFIIALLLCFPVQAKWIIGMMGWIIGGIFASVVGLVIYLVWTYDERQEKYMIEKFGEDYKEKKQQEGFGYMSALPCKPDPTFVSKSNIEKKANVSLPAFVVTGCSETLTDFTGDFRGKAIIEFDEVISDRIIEPIETEMTNYHSKWRKDEDLYICDLSEPFEDDPSNDVFWSISIRRNSKEGTIIYGRV